ncbi:UNVERIFIED_CONTAM: hypothetical protein EX528_05850 [Xanthomonas axonopodis]
MGGGDDRHQRHHSQDRPWAQTKMSERHRRQYSGKAGRVAAGATSGQGSGATGVSGPLAWWARSMRAAPANRLSDARNWVRLRLQRCVCMFARSTQPADQDLPSCRPALPTGIAR